MVNIKEVDDKFFIRSFMLLHNQPIIPHCQKGGFLLENLLVE
jgi:hypothetical protein